MADELKTPKFRKTDEITSAGQNAMEWASRNATAIIYAGGAVLFLTIVLAGFLLVKNNRLASANMALMDAVNLFQPLAEREKPAGSTTADVLGPERLGEALASFREVGDRYPSMQQGKAATIYAANILFTRGSYQEAISALEDLGRHDPGFLARYGGNYLLAKSYEAAGNFPRALAAYAPVRDRAVGDMRGQVLLDMARCLQLSGDHPKARELLQKILADFSSDSPLGQRADKMLTLMGTAAANQ